MKWIYILTIFFIFLLGASSFYLNSNSATGSVVSNSNKITGFAEAAELPGNTGELNESNVMGGELDGCFIYNNDCPDNTTQMLRVGNEFFDSQGGAHVAAHDNINFPWRMCCIGIIGGNGARINTLVNTGEYLGSFESGSQGGSHAMQGENSTIQEKDVPIANDIEYNNQECPEDFKCAGKISPLEFLDGNNVYNGHIWDCNQTFENVSMISICYKPEQETFCQWNVINFHAGLCNESGLFFDPNINPPQGEWLYCSFGKDDIQQEGEDGACCLAGEYSVVSGTYPDITFNCVASDECGFEYTMPCDFDHGDPTTPPKELYERDYFAQEGCVNWQTDLSCCWHIYKFGGFGNYPCDIFDIQESASTEPTN